MNKNVLFAAGVVVIFLIAALVLFQRSTAKPETALNLNPTPADQTGQNQLQASSPSGPLADSTSPSPSMPTPFPTTTYVSTNAATIKTEKGDIAIQLYPDDAPKTVTNFATLAKTGYYNNLTFHRVEPGFVIQGGDPNGDGTGGYSIYGPTFEDELNPNTQSYKDGYKEGVVAMANRGPNTNGSQFFIMLADNTSLPHAYTIFGKVTSGIDVVQKIQKGDKILSIQVSSQ